MQTQILGQSRHYFEDTKLPVRTWLLAIAYATDHPTGVSGTAMAKELGIPQKRAWYMLDRLRRASLTPSFSAPLGTYRPRPKNPDEAAANEAAIENSEGAEQDEEYVDLPLSRRLEIDHLDRIFRDLPRQIYGGTDFNHPADEDRVRAYVGKLFEQGEDPKPAEAYRWARRRSWKTYSAKALQSVVSDAAKAKKAELEKREILARQIKEGMSNYYFKEQQRRRKGIR